MRGRSPRLRAKGRSRFRIPDEEFLAALDGRLRGDSLRRIAIDLYGAARVEKEWPPDGAPRARVRVRTALELMNGDYREWS